MYKAKIRDKNKRETAIKLELKRNFFKAFIENNRIEVDVKMAIKNIFKGFNKEGLFVRCKNFCNITSKSRGVFRFFGIESFITRQEILNGSLNYIKYRILR